MFKHYFNDFTGYWLNQLCWLLITLTQKFKEKALIINNVKKN